MKNAKDLVTEEHHFPTRWFKQFMRGATVGVVLGSLWHFVKPTDAFAQQKLFAAIGEQAWTGRTWRLLRHTAPTHGMAGGSLFLGYTLILEFLRHHDETNMRPKFIDHEIAMAIIGAGAAMGMGSGCPWAIFTGAIFSTLTAGPAIWWLQMQGNRPGQMNRPANIFYTAEATPEEIERFRHQDQTDMLAF
jgi:hypothetical protein